MLAVPLPSVFHATNASRSPTHDTATFASEQGRTSSFGDVMASVVHASSGKTKSDPRTSSSDASSPARAADNTATPSSHDAPTPTPHDASDATQPPADAASSPGDTSTQAAPNAHAKRASNTDTADADPNQSTAPTSPDVLPLDGLAANLTAATLPSVVVSATSTGATPPVGPRGSGVLSRGAPIGSNGSAIDELAGATDAIAASAPVEAMTTIALPGSTQLAGSDPAASGTSTTPALKSPVGAGGANGATPGAEQARLSQADAQAVTTSLTDHGGRAGSDDAAITCLSSAQAADPSATSAAAAPAAPAAGTPLMPHAFSVTLENAAAASAGLDGTSTSGATPTHDVLSSSSPLPTPLFSASVATADGAGTSIRVNAGELGTIEVTLGKSDDGSASVLVAADRSDTLSVMAADHDQMQSILAQAGVETTGRRIEYALLPDSGGGMASGDWGGGGNGAGGGRGGGSNGDPTSDRFGTTGATSSQNQAQPRSASRTVYMRSTTVDITA